MVLQVESVEQFNELISNSDKDLVVVDFFAFWCPPCQASKPLYEKLSQSKLYDRVLFLKVDVDQCYEVAQQEQVRAMPTFKFYQNGEVIDSVVGANMERVEDIIREKLKLTSGSERALDENDLKSMRMNPFKNPFVIILIISVIIFVLRFILF
ncbi:hypothetical protein ABK040_011193 [Willaertia magna]